jgi:hypothetical protein
LQRELNKNATNNNIKFHEQNTKLENLKYNLGDLTNKLTDKENNNNLLKNNEEN